MMTKPGGFGIIFLIYFHTGKGIGGNRNERESGSAVWSATGRTAGGRSGTGVYPYSDEGTGRVSECGSGYGNSDIRGSKTETIR